MVVLPIVPTAIIAKVDQYLNYQSVIC